MELMMVMINLDSMDVWKKECGGNQETKMF